MNHLFPRKGLYKCKTRRVIDGDTMKLLYNSNTGNIRSAFINAAELNSTRPKERLLYNTAKKYLEATFRVGSTIYVYYEGIGIYGRPLCYLYKNRSDYNSENPLENSVQQQMLNLKIVTEYRSGDERSYTRIPLYKLLLQNELEDLWNKIKNLRRVSTIERHIQTQILQSRQSRQSEKKDEKNILKFYL